MFNLLVKGSPWAPNRDTIGRVLTYTSDAVVEKFRSTTGVRYDLLSMLPTIFAEETDPSAGESGRPQFARVGRILSATVLANGATSIEYLLDSNIPPIPQSKLTEMGSALQIDLSGRSWTELGTSHWAVKDVDLYRELLLHSQSSARRPRIFELAEPQVVDQTQVSAMMPFAGFDAVYEAIRNAATANDMRCNRADDFWVHHEIMKDVVSLIDRSAVVIGDCTARNPNVFYEIGIAHSLGKEVILITQDKNDIPFDLAHLRYVHYLGNNEGLRKLESDLAARIGALVVAMRL